MIPFTFPSSPSLVTGNAECKIFYLSSVVGMQAWTDYIPVRSYTSSSPVEGTTDTTGYQAVKPLSSTTGLAAWTDYIPVYEDASLTKPWSTDAGGYIPVGAAGSRLSLNFAGTTAIDSRITYTGGSSRTFFGSDGLLKVQGYNLLTYSQDFSNAAWATKTSITLTSGVSDPFGGNNAFTLQNDVLNTGVLQQVVTGSSATAYTGSIWVRRRVGTGQVSIRVAELAASPITITSTWTRVSYTNTSTTTTIRLGLFFSGGAVGDQIDIYGAQLEAGSTASQYSPTTTAANSAPRLDYDPATLLPRGLLVEEQRTQLLLQSNQFDTTWTVARLAAPTKTGPTAPDGSASWVITEDATAAATHAILQTYASWLITTAYTVSVYAKMGTQRWLNISLPTGIFTSGDVYFDLQSGVKGTEGGGATGTITAVGNGWYRCSVTKTSTAAGSGNPLFYSTDNGSSVTVATPSARTMYLYGAQLEAGAFPTSYIPTTTAAATRSADSASMTLTNFSSWFNQSAGTLYTEFSVPVTPSATSRAAQISGTAGFDCLITSGRLNQYKINAAFVGVGTTRSVNTVIKSIGAFDTTTAGINVDGVTEVTSANAPSGNTALYIGSSGGTSSFLNGHVRRLMFYPVKFDNVTRKALTS